MILVTQSNFHNGLVPVAVYDFMIKIMLVELFLESIAKLLKRILSKMVKKFVYPLH